jgi:hypothetical protein
MSEWVERGASAALYFLRAPVLYKMREKQHTYAF